MTVASNFVGKIYTQDLYRSPTGSGSEIDQHHWMRMRTLEKIGQQISSLARRIQHGVDHWKRPWREKAKRR